MTSSLVIIPATSSTITTSSSNAIQSNTESNFNNNILGKHNFILDFIPFIGPTGDFEKVKDINVYLNSLKNLLLTPLGTYVFDPTYGSELYKKIFEPADNITKQEIIYEIKNRVEQFDNRINITNIEILFYTDRRGFVVNVTILKDDVQVQINLNIRDTSFSLDEEEGQ